MTVFQKVFVWKRIGMRYFISEYVGCWVKQVFKAKGVVYFEYVDDDDKYFLLKGLQM